MGTLRRHLLFWGIDTVIKFMLLGACLTPLQAYAWSDSDATDLLKSSSPYQSPQSFLFELKFGPYSPHVDREFDNTASSSTPFGDVFGDGVDLLTTGELEWEIWRPFGTLAIGGTLGYYKNTVKAFIDTSSNPTSPSATQERSASDTDFTLFPLAALAIYRFDYAADRWHFPLVPFFKIGLNYTFWWMGSPEGTDLSGGTFGWQLNAGAAFLLDVLEPQAARSLDVDLGINHSYIFFEFTRISADGFGSSDALILSDTTWNAGIAFEF